VTQCERKLFLDLLEKYTRAFNGATRVPLDMADGAGVQRTNARAK
jgi:hypothetical protein